ncbi:hypothetical protein QJS66_23455 (plasmid) [Kocuria rhizophila]|nr:hypothetical protein QJS66_23455 [Kocuria rhizophila]
MPTKRRSTARLPPGSKAAPASCIRRPPLRQNPGARPAPLAKRKRRVPREPLSTRVPVTLRDQHVQAAESTGTGVQAMVEERCTEYLEKRGLGRPS